MKDLSKMEGKTNFSRRLKQFDGLTWLTLTPIIYNRSTPLKVQHLKDHELSAALIQNCRYYSKNE